MFRDFSLMTTDMKKSIFFFALAIVFALTGCKEIKVTFADSGKTINMVMGQLLKIELPSNASTGNTWRQIAYEDSVLAKSGKPNYVLGDEGIGSAGKYNYRFKTIGTGISKIYMEYGSKYDYSKKPLKIFELTVVVHKRQE